MFESDYRRRYLPLRDAGLVEIGDGPQLSGPAFVWVRQARPAPPRRSMPCSRGNYVMIKAGAKANPIASDAQPGAAGRLVIEAGRLTLTRIIRDETIELTDRYRIVELEFAAAWDPLYLRVRKAMGDDVPNENRKALLILRIDPRGGAPTMIGMDVTDTGRPYRKIVNARNFLLLRHVRRGIKY